MTKIKLTSRKQASHFSGSSSSVSNNNNTSYYYATSDTDESRLTYRPVSHNTSSSSTSNDEYIDSQFQKPPARVPTRSICLATFLCFAGSSLLMFGLLVLSGHTDAKFADRVWPMVIMGFLMFIPGAYHVRIAYYAYKGKPGYSFDDIPEFE